MTYKTRSDEVWESIKQKTWHKFPEQQIFIDEKEQIIVMRRKNNKIVVAGLLFSFRTSVVSYIFPDIFDFIKYMMELAKDKWDNAEIILITNFLLSNISHYDNDKIQNLPLDKLYFYFDGMNFIKQDLNQSIEFCLSSHNRYIEIQRNIANREKDPIDYESAIMRALSFDDADRFGF